MKFLVLNKTISQDSFLRNQLSIESYADLIVGRKNYVDYLIELVPELKNYQIIFVEENITDMDQFKSILNYRNIKISDLEATSFFLFYDLAYFPKDPELLNNIFSKIQYTEEKVNFYSAKEKLAIFKLPINELIKRGSQSLDIDISNKFLDTRLTSDVLDLFSSNFQIRYFNQLKASQSYYIKSSSNSLKMRAEYNFLTNIPSPLKPFFPQVGELKNNSYEIEKIYTFDLSKLLINKVLQKQSIVDKLLVKLKEYLEACPVKTIDSQVFGKSMTDNFVTKSQKRLEDTKKLSLFDKLNQITQMQGFKDFDDLYSQIFDAIKEFISSGKDKSLYFSHGDLCFSNILFDPHTFAIKLIDPRGFENTIEETYRPIYYDLAKLSHSFCGMYDLIVYDMFEIKINENASLELVYLIDQSYRDQLKSQFEDFMKSIGYDPSLIRLFEASLFISMIPLHQDSNTRMIAQCLQAIDSLRAYQMSSKGKKSVSS
ncbi:MAG: hypothetical protein LW817_02020 [Candidatus Caenarcaniphilales bacterium]|jgi:hypothetical protein|nr:hypothetical protein [Candidatus Caenarcaniphilales bacterium]